MQSLIKLSRTNDIFNELIPISKFYTDRLSSDNIFSLLHFFALTSKQITSSENEQLFFSSLKTFIGKIDIKKIPVFGLCLLFFMKPFNRKAVLKLLFESLLFVKHVGKYFILSSYYKEAIKSNSNNFSKKKKFLLRKDVRYPSAYTKNLE